MAYGIELRAEGQSSIAYSAMSGTYAAINNGVGSNAGPFDHPMRMLMFYNGTNALLQFSFDSVNDHFVLPANGTFILDVMTNSAQPNGYFVSVNTTIYVKEIGTPTSGSVYMSAFYAKGD